MSGEELVSNEMEGTEIVLRRGGRTKVARAVVRRGAVVDSIIYGPAGRDWDKDTYRNLSMWASWVANEIEAQVKELRPDNPPKPEDPKDRDVA